MIVFLILTSLSVNYLVAHWILSVFQIFFFSLWKELFSYILLKNVIGDIIIVIKVKIQLMLSIFGVRYAAI